MIIGTGIDIVDIDRFTIVFNRHRERFLRKFFTEAEILYSNKYTEVRKIHFFAGRFAIKEAIAKAFGCGFGEKLKWLDLEILPDKNGKPILTNNPSVHLSISHEKKYAIAQAILEN